MAVSSIGNGLSQPPGIVAGLSVYPRIAGAASGLLGFLQMMIAAVGALLVGQLPQGTAAPMVAVVGASLALALIFGLLALARSSEGAPSADTAPLRAETARVK
jgi:DHA1 family bicyclomycin/chloramphenicol resistance-like MFS transporter